MMKQLVTMARNEKTSLCRSEVVNHDWQNECRSKTHDGQCQENLARERQVKRRHLYLSYMQQLTTNDDKRANEDGQWCLEWRIELFLIMYQERGTWA